jgi:chromosome segregation ATPase
MTTATITLDRELVQRSFRDWQAEQAVLDSQLSDSVAALEAYQSHLDNWQRELARERDDLQRLRGELDRDKVVDGNRHETVDKLEHELYDSRAKITTLTTALLDRTEELRQLDRGRAEVNTELAAAKTRERDLSTALETLHKASDVQRGQWEAAIAEMRQQMEQSLELTAADALADSSPSDPPLGPIAAANPVLGSLMEQFDKLRQQRSFGRHSHTRTR